MDWLIVAIICTVFALTFVLSPKVALMGLVAGRTTLDAFGPDVVAGEIAGKSMYLHMVLSLEVSLLTLILVVAFWIDRGTLMSVNKLSAPAILFVLSALYAALIAQNVIDGLMEWLRVSSWILCMVAVTIVVKSKQDVSSFLSAGVLACIIPITSAFWDLLTGTNVGKFYGAYDISGWYESPPNLACSLFAVLPFLMVKIVNGRVTPANVHVAATYGLILGGLLISIFFTFYRTIWMASLVFGSVVLLFGRKKIYSIMCAVIILLLVVGNLKFVQIRAADTPLTAETEVEDWGQGRLGLWIEVVGKWVDNASGYEKLFGLGTLSSRQYSTHGDPNVKIKSVHNDLVELLVSQGMVGLGLFLWLLWRIWRMAIATVHEVADPYYRNLAIASVALFSFLFPTLTSRFIPSLASMLYIGVFWGLTLSARNMGLLRVKTVPESVSK